VTSRAAAVIAMTDLATSSVPSDTADRDAVRPSADRSNQSLEPDVLGDHHVARTIRPREQQRPAPSTLSASGGVPRSGIGIERGLLHGRSWTDLV
jgi:hypothetical protein